MILFNKIKLILFIYILIETQRCVSPETRIGQATQRAHTFFSVFYVHSETSK